MTNALTTNDSHTPAPRELTQAPAVDIYQNADELLLVADLPGVTRDGLEINYERGQISLKGRPTPTGDTGKLLYGFRERPTFVRTFSIPGTIDVSRINAELEAGVLKLHLPKMEKAKPRQIPISAGH